MKLFDSRGDGCKESEEEGGHSLVREEAEGGHSLAREEAEGCSRRMLFCSEVFSAMNYLIALLGIQMEEDNPSQTLFYRV